MLVEPRTGLINMVVRPSVGTDDNLLMYQDQISSRGCTIGRLNM